MWYNAVLLVCSVVSLPRGLAHGTEARARRELVHSAAELTVDGMTFGDLLHEPSGHGVLLFAYGLDKPTLLRYYNEALGTAQSFKSLDPRLAIAIATNFANVTAGGRHDVFDHVVPIRHDHIFAGGYKRAPLDGQGRLAPFMVKVSKFL